MLQKLFESSHCMKSVQIRSFFWSAFSRIRTEYGEILRISPYSARMRENTDQKNSVFGHFSRNGKLHHLRSELNTRYFFHNFYKGNTYI